MCFYIIYYNRFVSTVDRLSRPCIPTIYMYSIYIQLISRSWEAAKSKQNECNKRSGACHIIFQYNIYIIVIITLIYIGRYRASVRKLTSNDQKSYLVRRIPSYILYLIYYIYNDIIRLFFSRTSSTNMTRLQRHYSLSAMYIWSPRFRSVYTSNDVGNTSWYNVLCASRSVC